jgi:hypothetical protein
MIQFNVKGWSSHHWGCADQIKKDLASIQKESKTLHKVRFISKYLNKKHIQKLKSQKKFYIGLLNGDPKTLKKAAKLMCSIFEMKIIGEGNYNFTIGNRKGDCEKLALGLKLMCKYNKKSYSLDNFDEYAFSEYYYCCGTKEGRKDSRCVKRWPKCE